MLPEVFRCCVHGGCAVSHFQRRIIYWRLLQLLWVKDFGGGPLIHFPAQLMVGLSWGGPLMQSDKLIAPQ